MPSGAKPSGSAIFSGKPPFASATGTASTANASAMMSLRIRVSLNGCGVEYFSSTIYGFRQLKRRCGEPPYSGVGSLHVPLGRSRLELDAEQMRELGYRTVDALVDWLGDDSQRALAARRARPRWPRSSRTPPPRGQPFDVCSRGSSGTSSRTRAAPATRASSRSSRRRHLAGRARGLRRQRVQRLRGSWMEAAGPTQLELEVLGWFKDWVGYPGRARRVARHRRVGREPDRARVRARALIGAMSDDLVIYVSDQAHSSLARAARTLGFRPDQVRVLPVGEDLRLHAVDARRRDRGRRGTAAGARSASSRTRAPRAPVRSIRSRRSPTCAANTACGCTSTPRTAASPC